MSVVVLNEWAFEPASSFDDRCALAAEMGFDGIEAVYAEYGSAPSSLDCAGAVTLARTAASAGIVVDGVCSEALDVGGDGSVAAASIRRMIEVASDIGTSRAVVNLGASSLPAAVLAELLMEALAQAERLGVRLLLENGVLGDRITEPSDVSALGLVGPGTIHHLDVGNAFLVGRFEAWTRVPSGSIGSVHLKDADLATGGVRAFGAGDIDWPEVHRDLGDLEVVVVEHSHRQLGTAALRPHLGREVRQWAETGWIESR